MDTKYREQEVEAKLRIDTLIKQRMQSLQNSLNRNQKLREELDALEQQEQKEPNPGLKE